MNDQYKKQKQQIVKAIASNLNRIELLDGGGEFPLDFVFRDTRFELTPKGILSDSFDVFPFSEISSSAGDLFCAIDHHFYAAKREAHKIKRKQNLENFLNDTMGPPKDVQAKG